MIYVGILPHNIFSSTTLGSSLYISEFYDGISITLGGCLHSITVYKYLNSILRDSFGKPIKYKDEFILHKEAYCLIESYIKNYIRTRKLERIYE